MTTIELTLNLEQQVIDQIKSLAAEQGLSVSRFIEKHLEKATKAETDEQSKKAETAEWVKSIRLSDKPAQDDDGIADWVKRLRLSDKPTPDFDDKEEYRNYIIEKYSR